jgi:hypothetical protein
MGALSLSKINASINMSSKALPSLIPENSKHPKQKQYEVSWWIGQ